MSAGNADALARLARILEEAGGKLPFEEAAVRFLRADRPDLARKILANLIPQDLRFHVQGDFLVLRASASLPDLIPLRNVTFAVVDFETNGLPPGDRAIEVGVACFRDWAEVSTFETLIDPGTPLSPFVVRLTGIQPDDLYGKPCFEEIWPELWRLLEGRILVAHNLPFDRRILRYEVSRLETPRRVGEDGLCTLRLARRLLSRGEPKSLDALAERFGLEFAARHRALDDARVAGRVLFRLIDMAAERVPMETLGDLRVFLEKKRWRAGELGSWRTKT